MRVLAAACILLGLGACSDAAPRLVLDTQIVNDGMPSPLEGRQGDASIGKLVFSNREEGHCVLCHQINALDADFQGNLGPSLNNIGDRLTPAQLRLRIVDYQKVKPGTVMPSYYRIHDLYQVEDIYRSTPILTAQQVEDLVAYLGSLRNES